MKKVLKILLGVTAFLIVLSLFIGGPDEKKDEGQPTDKTVTEENVQLPEIPEAAMKHAYDIILGYDEVKDAHVEVNKEDKTISMAIQVGASINEETARELADSFVRALSSGVAFYNDEDELEPPKNDYLGELYDYYNLLVVVGSSPEHTIVDGAKVREAKNISW